VLLHSITAFGGPQAHFGMMQRTFVQQRKDVTDEELLDFNSFCNILPGATSTQVLTLIGFKRGGVLLATITLIIWLLPASILMCLLSFLVQFFQKEDSQHIFNYIQPMAIGFLIYAAFNAFKILFKNTITIFIVVITSVVIFILFKFPWVFPIVILMSGCITNISSKRIPQKITIDKKIQWSNLWLFALIFLLSGIISELARKQNWNTNVRKPINLFENTYRMGSFVFGGGQVLIPMMESQFSERKQQSNFENRNPNAIIIDKEDFYTGAGIVRAIPGPVFSIASFTGGLAMKDKGVQWQLFGSFIGTLAIFLPSALLVLFFFPIWSNLKKFATVYRALEGINASVVGIMIGSSIFMMNSISFTDNNTLSILNIGTLIGTFLILQFSKLPAPFIVLLCLLLGVLF
jgi:chromate transporter